MKAETKGASLSVIPAKAGIQFDSSWIPGLAVLARNDELPHVPARVEVFVSEQRSARLSMSGFDKQRADVVWFDL